MKYLLTICLFISLGSSAQKPLKVTRMPESYTKSLRPGPDIKFYNWVFSDSLGNTVMIDDSNRVSFTVADTTAALLLIVRLYEWQENYRAKALEKWRNAHKPRVAPKLKKKKTILYED